MRFSNLHSKLHNSFWISLDWIFPPECIGCGKEGSVLCEDCLQSADYMDHIGCKYCCKPMANTGVCSRCQSERHFYEEIHCLAAYKGLIRESIHRLKYQRDIGLARFLAKRLQFLYESSGWSVDMIIPVPLSQERLKERGYNQAQALAYPLSLGLLIPLELKALVRVKETQTQVNLSYYERRVNLENAFLADPILVRGKSVLLIDDVFTTGATINSAAKALKNAGSAQVFALTVAKAT